MVQNGSLSSALMTAASNASRLNFQIQFQSIEKTVVNRLNKEIEDVVTATSRDREVKAMEKEYGKLNEGLPLYRTYLFGNEGNLTRLQELGDVVNDVNLVFETGATSLNADQASDINANMQDIVERIGNLLLTSHPDIHNSDIVMRLRGLAESFEGYTAEAGTIDAEGSGSPTNDNRALWDAMADFQSWNTTAVTITSNTIDYTNQLIIDVQTEMFSIESRMTEIQAVDASKVIEQVENLKERYAQLLQAISLSFEVSSGFADYVKDGLQKQAVAPGSIMNLFA